MEIQKTVKAVFVECPYCNSELKVEKKDIQFKEYIPGFCQRFFFGEEIAYYPYVFCPVCDRERFIIDNLGFQKTGFMNIPKFWLQKKHE